MKSQTQNKKKQAEPSMATELAKMIKEERLRLGLTQLKVSEIAKIRRATIIDIENFKGEPSIHTIEKIMGAMKLKLWWFVEHPLQGDVPTNIILRNITSSYTDQDILVAAAEILKSQRNVKAKK